MNAHSERIRAMYKSREPSSDVIDDWVLVPMDKAEEIVDRFVEPFYFGCEADDPMNAWALNAKINSFGAKLKAIFSSDIGHWHVLDMSEVVTEAYEVVEEGLVTDSDFRDFAFTNAVHLYADGNPNFFKGIAIESEAS